MVLFLLSAGGGQEKVKPNTSICFMMGPDAWRRWISQPVELGISRDQPSQVET